MSWINFYSSFADSLRKYRTNQSDLLNLIKSIYQELNINLPPLCNEGQVLNNIDPFTVYGLFNKGITKTNRIRIIEKFAEKLYIDTEKNPIPTDFAGIPILNNMNARFYKLDENVFESSSNNLWNMFESALDLADNENEANRNRFIRSYDDCYKLPYVKFKLSMGLFWSRPNYYLNLDKTNREYISTCHDFSKDLIEKVKKLKNMPSAVDYLELSKNIKNNAVFLGFKGNPLPELSAQAFTHADKVNKKPKKQLNTRENALSEEDKKTKKYWIYSPGRNVVNWEDKLKNGMMPIGGSSLGKFNNYASQQEMQNELENNAGKAKKTADQHGDPVILSHTYWQFYNDVQKGDIIFAIKGRSKIIGYGTVTTEYQFNDESNDDEEKSSDYLNFRDVDWTPLDPEIDYYPGEHVPVKILTDITDKIYLIDYLKGKIGEDSFRDEAEPIQQPASYTEENFIKDVYLTLEDYKTLSDLLEQKQNIILQGPPGVGKTYLAKRLAYSIMGVKDESRVQLVQFHQSYSYEDFVMGLRPSEKQGGFIVKEGSFYNFCVKAKEDPDNKYIFIIDEINRGNLSKIFGELFMLLEKDKHGIPITLLYRNERFSIPKNVYIIGIMNTADRSLAIMDYALRRRFAFFDICPAFEKNSDENRFDSYLNKNSKLKKLVNVVKKINSKISEDPELGDGYLIGHSYFVFTDEELEKLSSKESKRLLNIIKYELIPLLSLYWSDDKDKVDTCRKDLEIAIND